MRRVMVVDDEKPIVEGLRLIIKKDLGQDFEVVATANTGREALSRLDEAKPEIILIDVMMPGLSGLDTIREIRKRSLTVVFILITAYERFDIAREAVSLQVLDYLLKPLQREQVVKALRKAADQVEDSLSLQLRGIENQEQEFDSLFFLRKALAYGIMYGENLGGSLEKLKTSLELTTDWMAAGVIVFPGLSGIQNYSKVLQVLRYKTQVITGPLVDNRCLLVIPLSDPEPRDGAISRVQNILTQTFPDFFQEGGLKLGFGTPRLWPEAHLSWSEAQVVYQRRDPVEAGASEYFQVDESLQDRVAGGELQPLREQLDRDGFQWAQAGRVTYWGRSRWIHLLGMLYRKLVRQGLLSAELALDQLDFRELDQEEDPGKWISLVLMRLEYLAAHFKNPVKYSPLVAQILDIIRTQYATTLSLEVLADRLSLSPGRLSRLFIGETGQGFLEYLIEVRMDQARKMLAQSGNTVKMVSHACGYQDQNYFARLFKKMTGMTPSEYSLSTMEGNYE